MSQLAIKTENISKQYRLGKVGTGTLSHDLNRLWYKVRGLEDPYVKIGEANDRSMKGESDYVWSLRDINFEIEQGDSVGIIGRNGAGKSTLLKLLSKVTKPTTGGFKVNGRIASLLEVGTGFNPEMTGRENIYLNGAILGMRRAEITRKLDEIIDFSGVERYIDTPVKRYSSGMYVRLAFAVAAHLESEILIVDEVLAVGDAEFQKKCLGKMGEVSKGEGRTVLFVSHNLQAVSSLTTKSLVLEKGSLEFDGPTYNAIDFYLNGNEFSTKYIGNQPISIPHVREVEVLTSNPGGIHSFGKELRIRFKLYTPLKIESAALSYQIINYKGLPVLHILNLSEEQDFGKNPGEYELTSIMPKCNLYPGKYSLIIHFADRKTKKKYETISEQCYFEVQKFGVLREYYWYPDHAVYVEENKWEIK
ncbi:MAG: polysaccharide ABC transporter ATP-binding protein [Flavobacterium sp.]|uniref:ABC transporter ATP-binding protein n=1 Tax=Flavobacterium sp. TaxID=239 RepID=UPI003BD39331